MPYGHVVDDVHNMAEEKGGTEVKWWKWWSRDWSFEDSFNFCACIK